MSYQYLYFLRNSRSLYQGGGGGGGWIKLNNCKSCTTNSRSLYQGAGVEGRGGGGGRIKRNNCKSCICTTSGYEILCGIFAPGVKELTFLPHKSVTVGDSFWNRPHGKQGKTSLLEGCEHVRHAAPSSLCLITCLSHLYRRRHDGVLALFKVVRMAYKKHWFLSPINSAPLLTNCCCFLLQLSFTMIEEIRCLYTRRKPFHPSEIMESSKSGAPPTQHTPAYHGMR